MSTRWAGARRPRSRLPAFPQKDFDPAIIKAVFLGGFDKLREAGVALLGGHTVRDNEIKFGYAVTGEVDPGRILSNAGRETRRRAVPHEGHRDRHHRHRDQGRSSAGIGRVRGRQVDDATESSRRGRHRRAPRRLRERLHRHHGVRPDRPRDARSRAPARVTIRLDAGRIPLINGVRELARGNRPGGLASNLDHFESGVLVSGVNRRRPALAALRSPDVRRAAHRGRCGPRPRGRPGPVGGGCRCGRDRPCRRTDGPGGDRDRQVSRPAVSRRGGPGDSGARSGSTRLPRRSFSAGGPANATFPGGRPLQAWGPARPAQSDASPPSPRSLQSPDPP